MMTVCEYGGSMMSGSRRWRRCGGGIVCLMFTEKTDGGERWCAAMGEVAALQPV